MQLTRVSLLEPRVSKHEVLFAWKVEPQSPLFRQSTFKLSFPESIDLSDLPRPLWWLIAMICLHPQWILLRPCVVILPVELQRGEREFWKRLILTSATTYEAYRNRPTQSEEYFEIVEDGPSLEPMPHFPDSRRCVTALSGGKDSLLQAGFLNELTERPVFVTTTAPIPHLTDHNTPRRRHILSEVQRRCLDATLVEVKSDLREVCLNEYSLTNLGYQVSMNEMGDTHLYLAAALAAGLALGATHIFVASEAEVSENTKINGRIIQHPHCMYSAATQLSLNALLSPAGIHHCSLNYALHAYQVQRLLWTRYRGLRDLQYSCWRVGPEESTCSQCGKCLLIALAALELGESPEQMGIDLVKLLNAKKDFAPTVATPSPVLPRETVSVALNQSIARSIVATSTAQVSQAIFASDFSRLTQRSSFDAIKAYRAMRARVRKLDLPAAPGYREGFLSLVDETLRDQVGAVIRQYFEPQPQSEYAGLLARTRELIRWNSKPLGQDTTTGDILVSRS
jgi:hypothetical protein